MHLNPNICILVHEVFGKDLSNFGNIFFGRLEYLSFVFPMGYRLLYWHGIQVEVSGFGKPVLVMRDITERSEILVVGLVKLIETDYEKIVREVFCID